MAEISIPKQLSGPEALDSMLAELRKIWSIRKRFDRVEIAILCLRLGHIVREIAGRDDPNSRFCQPLCSNNLVCDSRCMGWIPAPPSSRGQPVTAGNGY